MRGRTFVCLILIIFLASGVGALSLEEAVKTARLRNPEIQEAKSRWEAARSAVLRSYSLPDPKIGADFEGIPEGSASLGQAEMRFYTLSQTVPWPGRLLSEGKAAAARAEMQRYAYYSKEREIARRVKSAYFELSEIDSLIGIMAANAALLQQAYRVAQTNYSSGTSSQIEVLKMQIELNRMLNELENLRDERTIKNVELSLLLNSSSEDPIAVDELPKDYSLQYDYGKVVAAAFKNSPALKMEEKSLEEREAMVGSAWSAYLPETMIKWRSQKAGPNPGQNDLMLEFSLPLWFLFSQNPLLGETVNTATAQKGNYQAMKNLVRREVKDHFTMLAIYRRKLKLYDSSLFAAARSVLEGSLAAYQGGKIEFMTLVDSIRSYLEINREYYETLKNYNARRAELEEVVGREIKEE